MAPYHRGQDPGPAPRRRMALGQNWEAPWQVFRESAVRVEAERLRRSVCILCAL